MTRGIITAILCSSILVYASGCVSARAVSIAQYQKEPRPGITSLVLTDGTTVRFDSFHRETGSFINGEIVGIVGGGDKVRIPVARIRSVSYNGGEPGSSTILVGGIIIGGVILGTLIASHPFF